MVMPFGLGIAKHIKRDSVADIFPGAHAVAQPTLTPKPQPQQVANQNPRRGFLGVLWVALAAPQLGRKNGVYDSKLAAAFEVPSHRKKPCTNNNLSHIFRPLNLF